MAWWEMTPRRFSMALLGALIDVWKGHNRVSEQPLIPEAMVTNEVVDDVGLWVDGGTQHHLSTSVSLHHVLDPSDLLH
jgi:hypothetical protein